MENCDSAPFTSNKVPYDPGWNDPPKLNYNSLQTPPNRPRNFLNKRVAFPLSGGGSAASASPSTNMPPLPTCPVLPIPNITPEISSQGNIQIDSESTLKEVKDILLSLLDSNSELGSKADSIKKRIGTMEDMWLNGKLNNAVQIQMKGLAYALKDNTPNKADDIHKALMVDHVSAVSAWMPGVKQLIYHCIARTELLAMDKD